jgi:hypothetical protein
MSVVGKWGWSTDGECYHGFYASREDAIKAGATEGAAEPGQRIFVGRFRAPILEGAIDASLILDQVTDQDDYCGDWAEDWPGCTQGQVDELTNIIRKAFCEWLGKHDLRPSFGVIDNPEELVIGDGPCMA